MIRLSDNKLRNNFRMYLKKEMEVISKLVYRYTNINIYLTLETLGDIMETAKENSNIIRITTYFYLPDIDECFDHNCQLQKPRSSYQKNILEETTLTFDYLNEHKPGSSA